MHGGQIRGVALYQGGGQLTAQHQLLRSVGVGHDALEQLHALHHARLNLLPFGMTEHEREQVERPGALRLVGAGVNVVGDAVVAYLPLQVGHAGIEVSLAGCGCLVQRIDEALPWVTDRAGCFKGFV